MIIFVCQVFKGRYRGQDVAVKVVHATRTATPERVHKLLEAFVKEAALMTKLHHPNLQTMLGVCTIPFASCASWHVTSSSLLVFWFNLTPPTHTTVHESGDVSLDAAILNSTTSYPWG